jgi:hypothetical protein
MTMTQGRRTLHRTVIAAAVLTLTLLSATTAGASTRITQGDAQAVANAFGSGGWAVINHNKVELAGPGDRPAAIRPLEPFDGRHYCALDWHAIVLADVEGGDSTYTQQQAQAAIDLLSVTMYLDGQQLQLTQTAVQRFNNPSLFNLQVAYYSQWGQVESPDALSVGSHTLQGVMTSAGKKMLDQTITFYIDPSTSTTCS